MKKGDNQILTQTPPHFDVRTPEYSSFAEIQEQKWETVRGIGKSFAYNGMETEADVLSAEELAKTFADVVSKNGKLLIGVGPRADGSIPEIQLKPLMEFGSWLEICGEAYFGTRPWIRAEGMSEDGIELRFTAKESIVYATLMKRPAAGKLILSGLKSGDASRVEMLGVAGKLTWSAVEQGLEVEIPENLPHQLMYVLKIDGELS